MPDSQPRLLVSWINKRRDLWDAGDPDWTLNVHLHGEYSIMWGPSPMTTYKSSMDDT